MLHNTQQCEQSYSYYALLHEADNTACMYLISYKPFTHSRETILL